MSSIECRFASLLAFIEARDRQTRLPFDDRPAGDDCGRQSGGRFGAGNNCAAGGSSSPAPQEQPAPAPQPEPPAEAPQEPSPRAGLGGGGRTTSANGWPQAWRRTGTQEAPGGIPGAEDIAILRVDNPKQASDIAKKFGVKSPASLLRIGAGTANGSSTTVSSTSSTRWRNGGEVPVLKIDVGSSIPFPIEGVTGGAGDVSVDIVRWGDDEPKIHYGYFQANSVVKAKIAQDKFSNNGESPTQSRVGALIMQHMLSSLEEAEKSGFRFAETSAAGYPEDSIYQGYRLWGKFGFDSDLSDSGRLDRLKEALDRPGGESLLHPDIAARFRETGRLHLQELLSTPQGENWWKRNGWSVDMHLDFQNKESIGYKRFRKMVDLANRAKARGKRSLLEFIDYATRSDVSSDVAEWRGFRDQADGLECRIASLMAFADARNCGTGSGGFQTGNTCASGAIADAAKGAAAGAIKGAAIGAGLTWTPQGAANGAVFGAAAGAVKGLYDNQMRPTRVMKTITKIGSTEEHVAGLVQRLGGSPKSSANVSGKSLTIKVKDDSGKKLFDVDMTASRVRVTPSRESGRLTSREMSQIKSLAKENSPKEFDVVVKSQSPSYVSTLVRKGFTVTADATGTLIASFLVPFAPGLAGGAAATAVELVTKKVI